MDNNNNNNNNNKKENENERSGLLIYYIGFKSFRDLISIYSINGDKP